VQLVLLDGIDEAQLRGVVGAAAFARGQECLRQRRVLHTEWSADEHLLTGLVLLRHWASTGEGVAAGARRRPVAGFTRLG